MTAALLSSSSRSVGTTRSMRVASRHLAIFDRHIEIKADDDALAGDIDIIKSSEGGHDVPYFFAALTTALAVMPKCL